jgi:hypothetical protein
MMTLALTMEKIHLFQMNPLLTFLLTVIVVRGKVCGGQTKDTRGAAVTAIRAVNT